VRPVCSGMHTRSQYLAFAEECERLAERAELARHRMVLKEMAQAWRILVREGDGTGEELRC
jgi:hypothetical protein